MGRISTYSNDSLVSLDDKLLGSNADDDNSTTFNYKLSNIFDTFKVAFDLASIEYIYSDSTNVSLTEEVDGYFTTGSDETSAPSITSIKINKTTSNGADFTDIVDVVLEDPTSFVLKFQKTSSVSKVFYFTIASIVDSGLYYTFNVINLVGSNVLVNVNTYNLQFEFATDVQINNPDEEDLTVAANLLKINDRDFNVNDKRGYKIIREGFDFSSIPVSHADSVWDIRYDFDLSAGLLTLPSGVTLFFNGGILTNGTITPDNTKVITNGVKCFDNCFFTTSDVEFDFLNPEVIGAVGDGATDDNLYLQSIFDIASNTGKKLYLGKGKTYLSNNPLNITSVDFDLNGSTLKFVVDANTRNLEVRDNCSIKNGSIINVGTGTITSGEYQCPILIGRFGTGESYENVILENLSIETNQSNANGILVTSASNNVTIDNIYFPSSSTIGRPILVHWGNADDKFTLTKHPFNVSINNIKTGVMSNTAGDAAIIFISGGYNITIDNVFVELTNGKSIITTFAGDEGDNYAATELKDKILKNIIIRNVSGRCSQQGVRFDGLPTLAASPRNLDCPKYENISITSTTGTDAGIASINGQKGVFRNCTMKGFLVGFSTGTSFKDFIIEGGEYSGSVQSGINITNGTVAPKQGLVIGAEVFGNGTSGSYGGIFVGTSKDIIVRDCIIGDDAETQIWGIRVSDNATNIKLEGNHVKKVKSVGGIGYSIGSSTVYTTMSSFKNNTCDEGIFQAGQKPLITETIVIGSLVLRRAVGANLPSSGDWNRGDIVYDETPTASGNIGWVCVASGTSGTWKTFGTIGA